MILWFTAIGACGVTGIVGHPEILKALSPTYALSFMFGHFHIAFFALAAVVLAVTGAEAIYADMGHFSRRPIMLGWLFLVLPACMLSYFGQGALVLGDESKVSAPFFLLTPEWARLPMVLLATAATVIASQAVITGAFSVASQAAQLGYLPRLRVVHTSAKAFGQVYVPSINGILMVGVLILVFAFESSAALAYAYGMTVTGTITIATILFLYIARTRWHTPLWLVLIGGGALVAVDLLFLAANVTKIVHGAWLPLLIALVAFTVMRTWEQGRVIVTRAREEAEGSLREFIDQIADCEPPLSRAPGTAVFLNRGKDTTPLAMRANVEHNHVRHDHVVILAIETLPVPRVAESDRVTVDALGYAADGIIHVTAHFGYMESPEVAGALRLLDPAQTEGPINIDEASYFLSKLELARGTRRPWRDGANGCSSPPPTSAPTPRLLRPAPRPNRDHGRAHRGLDAGCAAASAVMVCSRNVRLTWKPVDSRSDPDFVVAPDERLSWPSTLGLGAQHVVAMFGATFLVPVLTGFPPATTLLFSGVGTVLFLLITGNRLPSYLGSSFSVIAPVTAAVTAQGTGSALGGWSRSGLLLIIIGAVVHLVGTRWLDLILPPVVTGAIVALIGFNLAPAAKTNFEKGPLVGIVTLVAAGRASWRSSAASSAGSRSSWPCAAGYLLALTLGDVDTVRHRLGTVAGLPEFQTPTFTLVGAADVPARRHRADRREHRPRQIGRPDDRRRYRSADRPGARRRRGRHGARRVRRRIGDHDLRREHRRDGRDARLLDRGVLGRRDGRDRVVVVPQGRCHHLGGPAGRARRCDDRAVRPGRHPRCADLADQPCRLLQARQPDDRRHPVDHRHRRLQLARRQSDLHRHRARIDRRAARLSRHAIAGLQVGSRSADGPRVIS